MKRVAQIARILLESNEPVTIDEIARILKVSNKTVRNDMDNVADLASSNGLVLSKKPGVGVVIEGDEARKLGLKSEIDTNGPVPEPLSPEGRTNYLLKRLLINDGKVTIQEMADELQVSRVTVHKDLENVEQWIARFDLKLATRPNYGVEIKGGEENWRNAVASLIAQTKEQSELRELLFEDYAGRIDYKTLLRLKELVSLDYKQLEKVVTKAEGKLNFRFSDEAYVSFIIHVAIAIKRLMAKKDIALSKSVLSNLRGKKEYQIAREFARDIEETFKIRLPESEVGYILLHILGAKMQQCQETELTVEWESSEEDLASIMANEIIDHAENTLRLNLKSDKQLVNGLVLHLRPTINRLKYGLTLRNPLLNEIKENYPAIYGLSWMTSIVFEKYLGVRASEEEIGYIALHLGAAAERAKKPLRVLVVCASGIGTSQLLAARLERCFRDIEILEVVSAAALKEKSISDIDFIISTIPVQTRKPVITISPLLSQTDVKRLDMFLNEFNADKQSKARGRIEILPLEVDAACANGEQVISAICRKLGIDGYIKPEFVKSVLDREHISPTNVGGGMAIPHGLPEFVNKSAIACALLKKPISWGEDVVDIIFMLCIQPDHLEYMQITFKNIYNQVDNPEFLAKVRQTGDVLLISKMLGEMVNVNK